MGFFNDCQHGCVRRWTKDTHVSIIPKSLSPNDLRRAPPFVCLCLPPVKTNTSLLFRHKCKLTKMTKLFRVRVSHPHPPYYHPPRGHATHITITGCRHINFLRHVEQICLLMKPRRVPLKFANCVWLRFLIKCIMSPAAALALCLPMHRAGRIRI